MSELRLSPTEQIEAMRARRWLKKAERDVADRIRKLSVPVRLNGNTIGDLEDASTEFLKGVQLLAKARWIRDRLKASVL